MNGKSKDGLTYQALIELIKKSLLRIVIYVLIAAFAAGAIGALIIVLVKEESTFNAMVQYNYEGAEAGLDPWGRKLDVSKIKSDAIITQALIDNNYTEEERAELKNLIISNITIAGVVPEEIMNQILIIKEIATKTPSQLNELNKLSYYSTSYVVSLKNERKLKLSSKECVNILNSIVDNYILTFKETYGYQNVLGTLIASEVDKSGYDYIDLHNLYSDQISNILTYTNEMASLSGTFRSTQNKLSFNDLYSRVKSIRDYDLRKLEIFVYENGVSKEDTTINAVTFLEEKLADIARTKVVTEASLTATNTAIDTFEFVFNTTTTTENITVTEVLANGAAYDKLQEDARTFRARIAELDAQTALWNYRKTKIETAALMTPEQKTAAIVTADALLDRINTSLKQEIVYINEAVNEYIENDMMKNSISKSLSAVKVEEDNNAIKILFISELVIMFVAAIVAMSVTKAKENKSIADAVENEKSEGELKK